MKYIKPPSLLESAVARDWAAELELRKLGLSSDPIRVLKVRVDWENLGQKKFDGTPLPYMKCWFYEDWPNVTDDDDSWVEYPSSELVNLYLAGEPGDVELVDELIMELARDNGADLVWETIDRTWRDVETGLTVTPLNRLV